jgi:hypothetical protein
MKSTKIICLLLSLVCTVSVAFGNIDAVDPPTPPGSGNPRNLTLGEMGIADQLDFHLFCDAYDYNTGKYEYKEAKDCPSGPRYDYASEVIVLNEILNAIYKYLDVSLPNDGFHNSPNNNYSNLQDLAKDVYIGINHRDNQSDREASSNPQGLQFSVNTTQSDFRNNAQVTAFTNWDLFDPTDNPGGVKIEIFKHILEIFYDHGELSDFSVRPIDEYQYTDNIKFLLEEFLKLIKHELIHIYQDIGDAPKYPLTEFSIEDGLVARDYIEYEKSQAQLEDQAYTLARTNMPHRNKAITDRLIKSLKARGIYRSLSFYTSQGLDIFLEENRRDLFEASIYGGPILSELTWSLVELNDTLEKGQISLSDAKKRQEEISKEWDKYFPKRSKDRNTLESILSKMFRYLGKVRDRYDRELKRFEDLKRKITR